jgi:hypothetical protein
LGLFGIGEKEHPRSIYARPGPTVFSAVDFGSFVAPNGRDGKVRRRAIHRKTLAPEQLEFALSATAVAADASVRRDHAMARNVYGHGIVVHCIADGPCAVWGSRRCA